MIDMVQTDKSISTSRIAGQPIVEFTATFPPRANEIVMG